MDEDTASRFVASLVKSIQALCNGYIEFSTSIEVIGHIHLNIDRNCKFNYVLSEEVNKSVSEGSTIFSSHSYHSHPPSSLVPVKASSSVESAKGTHRKSQSVPNVHQGDTAAVTSLQKEVTVSHKDTQKINDYTPQTSLSDRLSESGDSSHSGKFSLNLTYESSSAQSGRLPQTSSTGTPNSAHSKLTSHNQDPLDRRRKAQTEVQTRRTVEPSPKRTRANDSGLGTQDSGFEVIEIKEEPSLEEPCVFFADSNSQIPMGQGDLSSGASRLSDLNQTPDFSKSVMESLERVGQLEGASLINPVDAQIQLQQQPLQQDQPFPVMLHANSAAQASSVALPGTSNQQGSAPSTSGGELLTTVCDDQTAKIYYRGQHPLSWLRHYLDHVPITGKKVKPQKRCQVCKVRGIRRDSRFYCPVCPEQPGLCRTQDCFEIYHRALSSIPDSSGFLEVKEN